MLPATVALTLLLLVTTTTTVSAKNFDGIQGSFCGSRPRGCCPDRRDDCSVPIEGTRCYCDDFCDRNEDDCCPDFFYVCRNITTPAPPEPIAQCWVKGVGIPQGNTVRINCNECKCQLMGHSVEMMCEQNECIINPTILTVVNEDRYAGWRASNYSMFWGHTLDMGLARRTGTLHSRRKVSSMRAINKYFDRRTLPLTYDLRRERRGFISPPLDQGWCASSWVMSTVGVASDRLAIMSRGLDRQRLSPQHLLSCNFRNQRGCDGGHLTRAWTYIQKFGLVPEECYPWVGERTACAISKTRNRNVTMARCSSGNQQMSLHRTSGAYKVATEEGIMNELMTTGSVQATMKVYQDFFMYRSGVYQCSKITSGHRTSYHSVRIVGWGEERQWSGVVKFWIAANSWGEDWGENGYFRIRRGTNECEIENFVIGAWINPVSPKLDPYNNRYNKGPEYNTDRYNRLNNRI